ncbi:MAG TPA: hypothetical protein VJ578_04735 [Dehalococcoidia bacterium]|nr:hypothetical protein [Dehalococcoidia bacterium]
MRDHLGNPFHSGRPEFAAGVLLLDDCEGSMTWIVSGTGGDDVHAYAAAAAYTGATGLHLKTRTTASAVDDELTVQKLLDYPASGLLVARLRLAPVVLARDKAIYLSLRHDDGAQQYLAALKLCPATSKTYYLDAAGTYIELTDLDITYTASCFYVVGLAIDCLAHQYLYAQFTGRQADLAGLPLYNDAATAARSAQILLTITATAAGPAEAYFDNIYCGEHTEI